MEEVEICLSKDHAAIAGYVLWGKLREAGISCAFATPGLVRDGDCLRVKAKVARGFQRSAAQYQVLLHGLCVMYRLGYVCAEQPEIGVLDADAVIGKQILCTADAVSVALDSPDPLAVFLNPASFEHGDDWEASHRNLNAMFPDDVIRLEATAYPVGLLRPGLRPFPTVTARELFGWSDADWARVLFHSDTKYRARDAIDWTKFEPDPPKFDGKPLLPLGKGIAGSVYAVDSSTVIKVFGDADVFAEELGVRFLLHRLFHWRLTEGHPALYGVDATRRAIAMERVTPGINHEYALEHFCMLAHTLYQNHLGGVFVVDIKPRNLGYRAKPFRVLTVPERDDLVFMFGGGTEPVITDVGAGVVASHITTDDPVAWDMRYYATAVFAPPEVYWPTHPAKPYYYVSSEVWSLAASFVPTLSGFSLKTIDRFAKRVHAAFPEWELDAMYALAFCWIADTWPETWPDKDLPARLNAEGRRIAYDVFGAQDDIDWLHGESAPEFTDILQRCLDPDPTKRWGPKDILHCEHMLRWYAQDGYGMWGYGTVDAPRTVVDARRGDVEYDTLAANLGAELARSDDPFATFGALDLEQSVRAAIVPYSGARVGTVDRGKVRIDL